jgi:hypothetical protein
MVPRSNTNCTNRAGAPRADSAALINTLVSTTHSGFVTQQFVEQFGR